eukprot:COSAG02_NODE_6_length_64796_cov_76.792865_20_plen_442_part_00
MDAMSDAIEGADVMLYGVSLAYKESANVRVASHSAFSPADVWIDCILLGVCLTDSACCGGGGGYCTAVPIGGQLRSSAGAGHDPTDDAVGLLANGLGDYTTDHGFVATTDFLTRTISHQIPFVLVQLGLLLGTRLWYAFWDADKDDDASFELRVDQVLREVAERGKPTVPESVPPERRPKSVVQPSAAPAPLAAAAPAPSPQTLAAPAPALAPAVEPEPAPEHSSFSTESSSSKALRAVTVSQASALSAAEQSFTQARSQYQHHMTPSSEAAPGYGEAGPGLTTGGNLAELTTFLKEQQRMQMERDAEAKAERAELEGRLEAARMRETEAKLEAQRRETEAKLEAQRREVEAKLEAQKFREVSVLQVRLEALHSAKLLADEEMFALEDIIADSFDDQDHEDEDDGGSRVVACEKVTSLVTLSGRIASNASFARQVRRKYVQ